ncbi:Gfo/Idh/MocA family oxidoreductase [Puteibacter caeruleilacunae]|nr:Gfo/Idh/MocA family oxidoreductase [Puteibacter caeruleilacunae]
MNKTYNWAILGCGKIAIKFANDLKLLSNANLYAAAARDINRAQEFADEFGFEKAYGSYEEMVKDPNVDVVYIATPHSHHCEHTKLCLNQKKAVLCEKAFGMNSAEVEEMIACAKENNTFLMEAFWTQFQPNFKRVLSMLKNEELGKLTSIHSMFAFNAPYDEGKRLYNVNLGGGSLLDIGIYPVFYTLTSLGLPEQINTMVNYSPTGSEESIHVSMKYADGRMASLISSFAGFAPTQTTYICENGYIIYDPRWFSPVNIRIWKPGEDEVIIERDKAPGMGYQHEASHVMECLDQGLIESPELSWQKSLDLIGILDDIRDNAGIVYPGEK